MEELKKEITFALIEADNRFSEATFEEKIKILRERTNAVLKLFQSYQASQNKRVIELLNEKLLVDHNDTVNFGDASAYNHGIKDAISLISEEKTG